MSQRSTRQMRSGSQRTINSSQCSSSSQRVPQTQSQRPRLSDDLVQKCVRFFLRHLGSTLPIKRAQVFQHLFKERYGNLFDTVVDQASEILLKVYGLKLHKLDGDSQKKYILTSALERPDLIHNSKEEELKTIITFLVLTHIFLSKDSATEISLWEFLKGLGLQPEMEIDVSNNIHTFVTKQLIKEQYIQLLSVGAANEDGEQKKRYSWGSRANECISKMEILKFVAKLYGNADMKIWPNCYEAALQQSRNVEEVDLSDASDDDSDE